MCGIAGFLNRPSKWRQDIIRMNQRMIHRGPDAQSYWSSEEHDAVLGHVRLAVVDLSEAGSQPMHSRDGRLVLVLNGEIYNYQEMKKQLISRNSRITFCGHSDTEVLLEYISEFGFVSALKESVGMFAAALYDKKERRLYLGRDRIGEKPLYYGIVDGEFMFASDLGCMSEVAAEKPEINRDALAYYFRKGYIPAPYTIYKDIWKAEAGEIIEISKPYREIKKYRYWDLMECAKYGEEHPFTGTEEEAADRLEELIKKSVKLQMAADVPAGAFLSGGTDSTVVAAVMQSLSMNKINSFSIGFEEDAYNEAMYAKNTAEYLGTNHTEFYVTSKDVMNVIPKLASVYSEPFADSSQIPTYLVSKLAREKVTVSLSGDAGDELFCGYGTYTSMERIWKIMEKFPRGLRKNVSCLAGWTGWDHARVRMLSHYFGKDSAEAVYAVYSDMTADINLLSPEFRLPETKLSDFPAGFLKEHVIENIMLMDMLVYLPDDILVKVDRAAMAVSLESRVPFLDKDIVEFAWTVPHRYKADRYATKKILKNVLYRYVPEKMMDRPKKGFSIPVAEWIQNGQLREWAEDLLNAEKIRREGIISADTVSKMWEDFKKDGRGAGYIWYLLMFEEWMEKVRVAG